MSPNFRAAGLQHSQVWVDGNPEAFQPLGRLMPGSVFVGSFPEFVKDLNMRTDPTHVPIQNWRHKPG